MPFLVATSLILAMAVAKTAVTIYFISWFPFTMIIHLKKKTVSPFSVSLLDWPCTPACVYCMLSAVKLGAWWRPITESTELWPVFELSTCVSHPYWWQDTYSLTHSRALHQAQHGLRQESCKGRGEEAACRAVPGRGSRVQSWSKVYLVRFWIRIITESGRRGIDHQKVTSGCAFRPALVSINSTGSEFKPCPNLRELKSALSPHISKNFLELILILLVYTFFLSCNVARPHILI